MIAIVFNIYMTGTLSCTRLKFCSYSTTLQAIAPHIQITVAVHLVRDNIKKTHAWFTRERQNM